MDDVIGDDVAGGRGRGQGLDDWFPWRTAAVVDVVQVLARYAEVAGEIALALLSLELLHEAQEFVDIHHRVRHFVFVPSHRGTSQGNNSALREDSA